MSEKPPQLTIARQMLLVVVIAVDVALLRFFFASRVLLIFFTLQVGLLCWLRARGTLRLFWIGFEVSGLAFMAALACFYLLAHLSSDRLLALYWKPVFYFALETLVRWAPDPETRRRILTRECQTVILEVVCFVPPLLASLMGGGLTVAFARSMAGLRQRGRG